MSEPYLPAHYLSARLFWLDVPLQHHLQHIILEAAARNLWLSGQPLWYLARVLARRLKESTCTKLGIGDVSHQEEGRCARGRKEALHSHLVYAATKLVGATLYSSPSGNHDRPVPVQCSTIVNLGLKSVTSCAGNQSPSCKSIFEYEMSHGFQVFSERNKFWDQVH